MKRFFVIQNHSVSYPDIVFQTDIEKDAVDYCEIMKRNTGKEYFVGTLRNETA